MIRSSSGLEALRRTLTRLLTDLPVRSLQQATERLGWYALGWKIEVFHKILKSGCKVEESRLRTAPRLVNLIATCSVVVWRIFWMTMVNRSEPTAAPTIALTQMEIDLLDLLSKSRRSTARGPKSLERYLDRIARPGGYLGRASDPPLGNIVMWRGLAPLNNIAIGSSIREQRCG